MSSEIKPSQLTRVGYSYQDLICIQILVDWFHNPNRYKWVSIEGVNVKGMFKGLDDVVALNKDDRYELYQVKFTTDANREDLALSFDWLLKKKDKGSSLIQKWASDVEKYSKGKMLSVAALKTNRIPDGIISSCLSGTKISYGKIPKEHLVKIESQLGGEAKTKAFFERFEFSHSIEKVDDLENKLKDSLIPDHCPSEEYWSHFLKIVERWASRKNEPYPDGKITIELLRQIFSIHSNKSISQYFEVPEGYTPPTEEFHSDLLSKVKAPGCWVVSAKPGMGKSTYLSHLTDVLIEEKIPVIRHHYSLTIQDLTDRITYSNAARSLQNQLEIQFPSLFGSRRNDPEQLDTWILEASKNADRRGKNLVVIIDGLDHVSRERSDISQLNHLVNRLTPLVGEVCLIFGTQPVADTSLPNSLLVKAPRSNWLELPTMDLSSINYWLSTQFKVRHIKTPDRVDEENLKRNLAEISEALLKISGGYPLHIIYSLNSVWPKKEYITKYDIESLPPCPEGDIHNYYHSLWVSLSESARHVLLLIAVVEFSWPDEANIGKCFEDILKFKDSFSEIQHLVEKRRSGISPFHGSLIVFLRNLQSFNDSEKDLLIQVNDWLINYAPDFWKWGWSWLISAKLGDSAKLITGVDRDWLLNSCIKGYPLQFIEQIIHHAEMSALDKSDFSSLVRLRLLKGRLVNGPEFQIQEFEKFVKWTLVWSEDKYGLYWRADNLRLIDDKEIPVVSELMRDIDPNCAEECYQEAFRRLKFLVRAEDHTQSDRINHLISYVLRILVTFSDPDVGRIKDFLDRLSNKEQYLKEVFDLFVETNNQHLILEFEKGEIPSDFEKRYFEYITFACLDQDIQMDKSEKYRDIPSNNILALNNALNGIKNRKGDNKDQDNHPISKEDILDKNYYDLFFESLEAKLRGVAYTDQDPLFSNQELTFSQQAIRAILNLSNEIYRQIKQEKSVNVLSIYSHLGRYDIEDLRGKGFEKEGEWHDLVRSIRDISIDLYLIISRHGNATRVAEKDFNDLQNNRYWNARLWIERALNRSLDLDLTGIGEVVLKGCISELVKTKDSTSQLANDSMDLANLAGDLHLKDINRECILLTARHIFSYGWRKDITLHEFYEAMEACSEANIGDVSGWLKRIAPFTNEIFDFTEREIRHIPGWFMRLLKKHQPERLVDELSYHLAEENWFVLDDVVENCVDACSGNSESDKAFFRCLTTYTALKKLEQKAEKSHELQSLYEEQIAFLGGESIPREERSSSNVEEKEIKIKFEDYRPSELEELKSELARRSHYMVRDFLDSWLQYWYEKGEGLEIINKFESYYEDNKKIPYDFTNCLHKVFVISKELQGVAKAYNWAVRDVRENNHWSRWNGSRSEEVLEVYAKQYKRKWKTFLLDTISGKGVQDRGNEWIAVPTSCLVKYLIWVGKGDLARDVAEAMLMSIEAEIAHLPIDPLHWSEHKTSEEDISKSFLLLIYKWPDRLSRIRTANEISKLLGEDEKIRAVYLEVLSKQKSEMDVVDYLSILLSSEYTFDHQDVINCIKSPSLLSDEILSELFTDEVCEKKEGYYSLLSQEDYIVSEKFEKAKNGMAPVYYHIIGHLGQKLNYPLLDHMSAEWEQMMLKDWKPYFSPYSFCGDHFYPQDTLTCSFSTQQESGVLSAYLRTLCFALMELGANKDEVMGLVYEVHPFGEMFAKMLPGSKPPNWPELDIVDKEIDLPCETDLVRILETINNGNEKVLRANGPVSRVSSGVHSDLDVLIVVVAEDAEINAKELYENIVEYESPNNIYTLAECLFPASFGRWEVDCLSRGLFRPTYGVGNLPVASTVFEQSCMLYKMGDIINASWNYWTFNWYPTTYRGLGAHLGTCLSAPKEVWEHVKSSSPGKLFILGKMTMIDRRDYLSKDSIIEVYAAKEIVQ